MSDRPPLFNVLRTTLHRRVEGLNQGAEDLQVWRNHLLNGLCAVALILGLVVVVPSTWGAAQQEQWFLIGADVLGLSCMGVLHVRRDLGYRRRALGALLVVYLLAVVLLFSIGPLSQTFLMAVPVLCTVLIGSEAAILALLCCGATLFGAGYLGGIEPGLTILHVSLLVHWTVVTSNFMLVAAILVVSCAYLLHGLDGALVRQRASHARIQENEARYRQTLEAQIAKLQAGEVALNESVAAQRAAEVSNQLKSEFLAMISHEVRTPLGGVISMLRLAQKDAALAPDTRGKLRISQSNAEVLLQIINDILDFSRLEAGKMPLEEIDFDLPGLLHGVIDLLSDRAESKGISLVAELDPELPRWWRGDPTRIRQVAVNLVGNGIKFTDSGEVRLGVRAMSGGVRMTVSDTGIGIAADAIGRLFQKFEQADAATSRKYGGTGLGLAICKNIAAAMGGRIEVHSTLGQGSVFRVFLPLLPGAPVRPRRPELSRPHRARLAVLCAEDGSTNQIILRELLGGMGHTVTIAEDGGLALAELAAADYDLVIMDSRMPRMDGLSALQRLRAGGDGVRNRAVPVIALTANATADERARFLAGGANGFLSKPIDELDLHDEIARHIDLMLEQGRPLVGELAAMAAGAPALAELDAMFGLNHHTVAAARVHKSDAPSAAMRAAFLLEGPRLQGAMQQGMAAADARAVALAAHSLMGSAGYFGAETLSGLCGQIEKLADAGALEAIPPRLATLQMELASVLARLAPEVAHQQEMADEDIAGRG
jgi:signal transduction histidine kinase/AmiR/NasT family two-component response regulator/HPt (histidine-containing phosphotransfer) domain-containing protein